MPIKVIAVKTTRHCVKIGRHIKISRAHIKGKTASLTNDTGGTGYSLFFFFIYLKDKEIKTDTKNTCKHTLRQE